MPIQIYRKKINSKKIENCLVKDAIIFLISAQNIDCGYSLEPPPFWAEENNVYPYKPQFYYIKVEFKGVKIT